MARRRRKSGGIAAASTAIIASIAAIVIGLSGAAAALLTSQGYAQTIEAKELEEAAEASGIPWVYYTWGFEGDSPENSWLDVQKDGLVGNDNEFRGINQLGENLYELAARKVDEGEAASVAEFFVKMDGGNVVGGEFFTSINPDGERPDPFLLAEQATEIEELHKTVILAKYNGDEDAAKEELEKAVILTKNQDTPKLQRPDAAQVDLVKDPAYAREVYQGFVKAFKGAKPRNGVWEEYYSTVMAGERCVMGKFPGVFEKKFPNLLKRLSHILAVDFAWGGTGYWREDCGLQWILRYNPENPPSDNPPPPGGGDPPPEDPPPGDKDDPKDETKHYDVSHPDNLDTGGGANSTDDGDVKTVTNEEFDTSSLPEKFEGDNPAPQAEKTNHQEDTTAEAEGASEIVESVKEQAANDTNIDYDVGNSGDADRQPLSQVTDAPEVQNWKGDGSVDGSGDAEGRAGTVTGNVE